MARLRSLLILVLSSSFPLAAQNISMEDFRIPESRYRRLLGNIQGDLNSLRSGESYGNQNSSNNGSLALGFNHLLGYSSENESYNINTSISGSLSQSASNYNYPYYTSQASQKSKNGYEQSSLNFSGQYASYVVPDRTYLYVSGALHGVYELSKREADTSGVLQESQFYKNRVANGIVGIGAGYGKTREASSVFAVVRILERLQEDGYLTRELSKEEILEIVNTYARRYEYVVNYDRPNKYFLDDLFKKLEAMGVLKEARASAYEVSRVEEVFFYETIYPRYVGWTVQGGIEFGTNQQETSSGDSYGVSPLYFSKSQENNIVVSAQYGHPFSLSLHWYSTASLHFPVYGKQNRVDQYLESHLYYQIGEKIRNDFGVLYQRQNQYFEGQSVSPDFQFNHYFRLANNLSYFIENHITASLNISYYDQLTVVEYQSSSNRLTNGGIRVTFGLTYRLF